MLEQSRFVVAFAMVGVGENLAEVGDGEISDRGLFGVLAGLGEGYKVSVGMLVWVDLRMWRLGNLRGRVWGKGFLMEAREWV